MSTVTLNYPDVIRVRRVPAIGQILILSSLALIGITLLLTVISANVALSDRAAVSQSSFAPIPVPVAPITGIQLPLTEAATPAPRPIVIAVPVSTPPSQ